MTFFTDAVTASEANLDGYEGVFVSSVRLQGRFFFFKSSLTKRDGRSRSLHTSVAAQS